MVVAGDPSRLDELLAIAEPLARRPARELILVRLVGDEGDLTAANAELAEKRHAARRSRHLVPRRRVHHGGARVRCGATRHASTTSTSFSSTHRRGCPRAVIPTGIWPSFSSSVPSDVAVLVGAGDLGTGPVVTPFGGVEHDWSAIELAAWLAHSLGTTLRLLGTEANTTTGQRDASRLLARASMLVQQVVGIVTEPVLVRPGEEGVLDAAHDARLLVIGLSDRWPSEGIGSVRLAVVARAGIPTLFVRRGLRPSGVAPIGR